MRAARTRRTWGAELAVELTTDDESTARWFRDHLHSWRPPAETDRVLQIEVLRDRCLLRRLQKSAGRPRRVSAYRDEVYELRSHPGGSVLLPEGPATHALVTHGDHRVEVVVDSIGDAGPLVVRVAREVIRQRLLRDGCVPLHASCVEISGRGVAFVGDSGAGKTTLALAVCAGSSALLVSNERLFVDEAQRATSLPMSARLGAGALQGLGLDGAVVSARLLREQPALSPAGFVESAIAYNSRVKVDMTGWELEDILQVRSTPTTEIEALVLVERIPGQRVPELAEAPLTNAELQPHVFDPDPDWRSLWLAGGGPPEPCEPGRVGGFLPPATYRLRWDPLATELKEMLPLLAHAVASGGARTLEPTIGEDAG